MNEFAAITLENEMDLTLAYKKSIRVAELLGLTISTQTAFATAVSEVCREVIDKALDGVAVLGVHTEDGRFNICARISGRIDEDFSRNNHGFEYARKLIPVLDIDIKENQLIILLKLSIPRATRVDNTKVMLVKKKLQLEGPISAYEEVKLRNAELSQINQQKDLALVNAESLSQQKNEFLSVASHELNTPLTILRSFTQIAVRTDNGDNPALTKYLNRIDKQSVKLVTLIQQLLDISKIEHGHMVYNHEVTDLNEFIITSVDNLKHLMPENQFNLELGKSGNVNIDRIRIEQVFNNLIINAAKYSAAGSCITVSTTMSPGLLNIHVSDVGIGMDGVTAENIFNKFYRNEEVAKKHSGLGMGLYIASRIIADHHGNITVKSTEGKGSVFSFTLPLAV